MATKSELIKQQIEERFNMVDKLYKEKGITLKPYQNEGIRWMLTHEALGKGALLADEPGLGKTFQSLGLIVSDPLGISLVSVPSSTLPQWTKDAIMFLGKDCVYVHHGANRLKTLPSKTRMVITTPETILVSGSLHDKFKNTTVDLHRILWKRIIVDEIHVIKNRKTKLYKCFMSLRATHKWGLTGTPVQNAETDIANIFRFVTNSKLDEPLKFNMDVCLKHFIKRRKKTEKLNLPSVNIENHVVDFKSKEEKIFYEKIKKNIKKEMVIRGDDFESSGEEMAFLFELLLRLRQTSQHPQLVIDGYERKFGRKVINDWEGGLSSKHQTLVNLIKTHPQDGSVVFSHFTQEMNILETILNKEGHSVRRIDGSLSQKQKAEVLNGCSNYNFDPVFNEMTVWTKNGCVRKPAVLPHIQDHIKSFLRPDILLIQIKAGGVGLNLQAFNRVYITSPDWNPANEDQAIARCWRMGQTKQVIVKRLVLADNSDDAMSLIDNQILNIQERKRQLQSNLLNDEDLAFNGNWSRKQKSGGAGLNMKQVRRLLK